MADILLESFPFDSMEVLNQESSQMEPDREYAAEVFRRYFRMFLSNGVYFGDYKNYGENSMKVTTDGGMNVKVAKGAGLIEGADYENTEERIITLERPITATRKDRIVVQFNASLDTRATKLIVKQGTGESTVAELQRDENIYEICIAEVTVRSTSNITAEDVKDTRLDKNICGIVNSLISVDGEELYQQFQEYIGTISDNLMLKNQDNVCTGKITASGGFEGSLNGNVSGSSGSCTGNAATATKLQTARNIALSGGATGSASFNGSANANINVTGLNVSKANSGTLPIARGGTGNSTGNAATATKLQTARNIALTGDVTGSVSFDGSKNVSMVTNLANVVVLTGTMSNGSKTISYPSGYNKDNCVVITKMLKRVGVASSRGYSIGTTFLPADGTSGSISSKVELQTSSIVLTGRHLYLSSSGVVVMDVDYDIYYKIVLMKI